MKFNLNTYAGKDSADDHSLTEKKLQQDHEDVPEVITEEQLEKDRVPEKEVLTEKLLEKNRTGGADSLTEKNLDDSKSKLVQHRNTSAYDGDINKLEEQRVANKKKQESEKYVPASETPKKMRWWEHLKASSDKKIVTAQSGEMSFDGEGFGRIKDTWSDEDGVGDSGMGDFTIDDITPEDTMMEELGGDQLTIDTMTPMKYGLIAVFDISPSSQADEEELKEMAYGKLLSDPKYAYLGSVDTYTPESFKVIDDKVVGRLLGPQYSPFGKEGYVGEETSMMDSPFSVNNIQDTDVAGIVVGTISVKPEMIQEVQDMPTEEISRRVADIIAEQYPEVSVESDALDFDKVSEGEISFVGQKDIPKKKGRPESYENVTGDPIASNDFDIVVLSNTETEEKKN